MSQIKTCARTADKVALMADHHKGGAVPIGGVVAYKVSISPSGGRSRDCVREQSVAGEHPGPKVARQHRRDYGRHLKYGEFRSGPTESSLCRVFVGFDRELAFGFLRHQVRTDERIEITVENFVHVTHFKFRAVVFY